MTKKQRTPMTADTGPSDSTTKASQPTSPAVRARGKAEARGLRRLVFLIPAVVAVLAGLDAALLLLGLPAPVTTERLPQVHGFLLVFGFVGTLIALERSVALGRWFGYFSPALLGIGGIALITQAPLEVGKSLLLSGCFAMIAVYIPLWRRSRDVAVVVQIFGAVLGAGGAMLWLGGVSIDVLLPWLVGFVVLTIAGERLELARIVALQPHAGRRFLAACTAFAISIVAALLWPSVGYPLLGMALLALVAWLAVYDIARRTIRGKGLVRFSAACLLAGYAWLACTAMIWILSGHAVEGAAYDAVIHAVFLGFTMSMIFAHASVILPAVLRRPLPYHPIFILPAALLHLSLILRLVVGDAREVTVAWQWGGVLNIVSMLLFFVLAAWSSVRTPTKPKVAR